MTTGERIRSLRDANDWSQSQLIRQIYGVVEDETKTLSRGILSKIENDKRRPALWQLEAMAQVFDTTTDYLLCLTDDPHPQPGAIVESAPYPELTEKLNALEVDTRAHVLTTFFSILDIFEMDPEEAYRLNPDPRAFLDLLTDEEWEEVEAAFLERHQDKRDDT